MSPLNQRLTYLQILAYHKKRVESGQRKRHYNQNKEKIQEYNSRYLDKHPEYFQQYQEVMLLFICDISLTFCKEELGEVERI